MRLILALLFVFNLSFGQSLRKIDSLKKVLTKLTSPDKIAGTMGKLSYEYGAINHDSAIHYALKSAEVARLNKSDRLLANAYVELGNNIAFTIGPDTSNYYFNLAAKIYEKVGDTKDAIMMFQNIGINYGRVGDLKISIDNFFKALKLSDGLKDSLIEFQIKKNIGLAYFYYDESKLALKYSVESYNYFKFHNYLMDLADCANNIGITYAEMDSVKLAKKYLDEAIDYRRKTGDTIGLITAYLNIGNTFHSLNEQSVAEKYYTDGANLAKKKKQISSLINCLLGLGTLKVESKDYNKAIGYFNEAVQLSEKDGYLYELKFAYNHLSKAYAGKNDYKAAFHFQELHNRMKDTLYNKENDEVILQTEAKYQSEKKQLQIDNLNKEKRINEIEMERQNTIKLSFGIGFILCLVIAFVLLRGYRSKKKSADELQIKNTIIETQKHEVEEKQKEILDSISYAKRLQEAILPPKNLWKQQLPDSFVLYKPKDIVAGDFYWLEHKENLTFVAAADCTGHGVPGAMVSVVCSNALNRAVKEFNLTDPGKILDKVRELVIETFEKSEDEVKDGMDISLCVISNIAGKKGSVNVLWAGANNPLWYSDNGKIIEITAHKQPIGKTDNPLAFPVHSLEIMNGESIFLFTDGYADQFGGPKGKKLKYKNFMDLMLKNCYKPIEEQKEFLDRAFTEWKGSLEQVDDVTVIGIRV